MSESEEKVLLVSSKCPFCEFLKEKIVKRELKINIVNVDTEEGKSMVEKYGIEAVPECMMIIKKDGVEQGRSCSEEELEDLLKET